MLLFGTTFLRVAELPSAFRGALPHYDDHYTTYEFVLGTCGDRDGPHPLYMTPILNPESVPLRVIRANCAVT